jgi:hypothetical protein
VDSSSLFLVRVWHGGAGFRASVRRASDERTHHFDTPESVVVHLSARSPAVPAPPASPTACKTVCGRAKPHTPQEK